MPVPADLTTRHPMPEQPRTDLEAAAPKAVQV